MRSKKIMKNVLMGYAYEFVSLVCGLILPRIILLNFGSTYNGLTSSITQFLSCISLLKAGVGGVTKAALYKPLAEKDTHKISVIIKSTEAYMRKVALIFIGFVTIFACIYPIFIDTTFDWAFSASLIVIIGIGTFVQYYFGITYQMLLIADQKENIIYFVQIVTTILNTVIAAIMIHIWPSIHAIKLFSALAYCFNPFFINYYCKKRYKIDHKVNRDNSVIKQRWDALGQQVAQFIHLNTDIMVITVALGVTQVSIYTVYAAVTGGLRKIINISLSGFGAAFGDMYARKEIELMKKNLGIYEIVLFSISTILLSTALVMLMPYISLYTKGVNDANYYQKTFAVFLILSELFNSYMQPYQSITNAAGKYKETKRAAYIEAGINIGLSIVLVFKLGLVGVAIGTAVAMIYRASNYAIFLSKKLLNRSLKPFVSHVLLSVGALFLTYGIAKFFVPDVVDNVAMWLIYAMITFVISVFINFTIAFFLFRKDFEGTIAILRNLFWGKKANNKGESNSI